MKAHVVYHLAPAWERAIPEALNPVYQPFTVSDLLARYPLAQVMRPSTLIVWATPAALAYGFELLHWWGYHYETAIVWHRSGSTEWEIGLIGWRHTRIVPETPIPTLVHAPETPATRVPTRIYQAIQNAYPRAQYIDLLAPQPPRGWNTLTHALHPATAQTSAQATLDHS